MSETKKGGVSHQRSPFRIFFILSGAIVLLLSFSAIRTFAAVAPGKLIARKYESRVIDTCRQQETLKERLLCAAERIKNRRPGDPPPEPLYDVIALQSLPGGYDDCDVADVNENNQVAGRCRNVHIYYECDPFDTPGPVEINRLCPQIGGHFRAVLWDQYGRARNLGVPINQLSYGTTGLDLNDQGNVAGFSQLRFEPTAQPMIYINGRMKVIEPFPQFGHGMSQAINNRNQVVGWDAYKLVDVPDAEPNTDDKKLIYHSFLLEGDAVTELPSYDDFASSRAEDINEEGFIVGSSEIKTQDGWYTWRAVSWDKQNHAFTLLDDRESSTPASFSLAVNNLPSPQIVGYWQVYNNGPYYSHGFLWQRETGIVDLGTYGGCGMSYAFDINNHGMIVGSSNGYPCNDEGSQSKAVLWILENNGNISAMDLNNVIDRSSGWHLTLLQGINDQGLIVGEGYYNGQRRQFLLAPRE